MAPLPSSSPASAWQRDTQFRGLLALLLTYLLLLAVIPPNFEFGRYAAAEDLTAMAEGSFWGKVQFLPVLMIGAAIVLWRYQLAVFMVPSLNLPLVALLLWCLTSMLWSVDPAATLRRSVKIIGFFALFWALCLAAWHPRRFENLVRGAASLLLLASLGLVLVKPAWGVTDYVEHAGLWRGIMQNKNTLGNVSALTLIVWVQAWAARRLPLRWTLPGIGLCLLCLLGARSTTAILCGGLGSLIVIALLRAPLDLRGRWLGVWMIAVIGVVLPIWFVAVFLGTPSVTGVIGPIAGLFGKDATLTGRSDIWVLVLDYWRDHALLGSGYGSFWLGLKGPSGVIAEELGWIPFQAHNGYIDILNELGLVGLILLAAWFLVHLQGLREVHRFDPPVAALHLALFVYALIYNISESVWLRPLNFLDVLVMYSTVEISRQRLRPRLAQISRPAPRQAAGTPYGAAGQRAAS
ncbi:MAG TPA: O-antigen ligase family protein [Nevskiaceae bacterium]|nr:O-antigen ligase family protein [Nevskiaceae bacterium]